VGYLFANFSLRRPLCSRVRPDVRDRRQTERRQTSDRRQTKASLNASALWAEALNDALQGLIFRCYRCLVYISNNAYLMRNLPVSKKNTADLYTHCKHSSKCVMNSSFRSHHTSNASLHYLVKRKYQETRDNLKQMSYLKINLVQLNNYNSLQLTIF